MATAAASMTGPAQRHAGPLETDNKRSPSSCKSCNMRAARRLSNLSRGA
jgi:hypothetical protein